MDPYSSILVSSLGCIEIDQSIELQWGNFVHSDGLLLEMYRVSDVWRSHTRSTIRVACIDFTLAIFSMGHRYYFDQLSHLDERRLRAVDHIQAYQRKMVPLFQKEGQA